MFENEGVIMENKDIRYFGSKIEEMFGCFDKGKYMAIHGLADNPQLNKINRMKTVKSSPCHSFEKCL